MPSGASALGEHIEQVPLIDRHVHGCWLTAGDRRRFENGLNEANIELLAEFDMAFALPCWLAPARWRRYVLAQAERFGRGRAGLD